MQELNTYRPLFEHKQTKQTTFKTNIFLKCWKNFSYCDAPVRLDGLLFCFLHYLG